MKLDPSWYQGLSFKVAEFFGLFNLEWHYQNEVGNIAILVLWRDGDIVKNSNECP